jgi:SAM-dependent methyltransferase
VSRFRPLPAGRYIHPRAASDGGAHDANLDVAGDSAPNYLGWVAEQCMPHLGRRVLEVGAGIGAITARYQHGRQVVANDLSPVCVAALRDRFAGCANVRVDDRDLRTLRTGERFDSVLMVNVLVHVERDDRVEAGRDQLGPVGDDLLQRSAAGGHESSTVVGAVVCSPLLMSSSLSFASDREPRRASGWRPVDGR